jgi:glycosyltransferase involved in cell wall biosynthesis
MDWLPFDSSIAAPIDAVLDCYQPDLVHAHCIQRLTATLLERVAARDVPYIITVHDAWWISDHQFLTDHCNRLRMPWELEEYGSDFNPHTRGASLARQMGLKRILGGARAILVVSEPFAEIYRRAGVSNLQVVRNAVPILPPLVPTTAEPGRVRLAQLGGVQKLKGYNLLRSAIRYGRLRNIELLVIDHSLSPWEERHEIWGTTPVRFVGLVPQDQVGALYGQFDILCALSLWPESFGLVVREALHYGKWVIVSGLGALAEDVLPRRNGWVLDVSDMNALVRLLRQIDSQPEEFVRPTGLALEERTVSAQTGEIVSVYRRILGGSSLEPSERLPGKTRVLPARSRHPSTPSAHKRQGQSEMAHT